MFWQYSLDVSPSLEEAFLLLPHKSGTSLFLLDMALGAYRDMAANCSVTMDTQLLNEAP